MENASKALIMAASVLIALMILAGLIFMYNQLQNFEQTGTNNEREAQVVEFNNQYESFNKNNLRGSELYSLLNRVIDYDRRKSSASKNTDEGKYLAYEPMTIEYKLDTSKGKAKALAYDEKNRIFTGEFVNFTLNDKTCNELENQINKFKKEWDKVTTERNMETLASGIQNLYGKQNGTEEEQEKAVQLWNRCIKGVNHVSDCAQIESKTEIKEAIYSYYEFMQFKRAHFDCKTLDEKSGVEYDKITGRIIKMVFTFNGKIN